MMMNSSMEILRVPQHLYNLINLQRDQYCKRDVIKRKQEQKLRRTIKHAYEHVGYYKELFDRHKIDPYSINTLEDLRKIPISSREDVQKSDKSRIIAGQTNMKQCYNYKTGGSTGIPLNIYISNSEMRARHMVAEFMYFENGFGLTDKTIRIFGAEFFKKRNLLNKLGIMDRRFLVLDSLFDDVIAEIGLFKPDLLISYSSKILELAKSIRKKQRDIKV